MDSLPAELPGKPKNTGGDSLPLLHWIIPTRESNQSFLHCRQILFCLSHQESPRILEWVASPFSSRSSWPRNQTRVSCIAGRFFTSWAGKEVLLCLKTATILTSGCHSSIYIHLLWGCIQIDSHTVHPLLGLAPHHQHHLWDSSVLCVATVQSSSLLFSVPFSGIWALEYNIEHRAISIWGLLWIVLLSYFQQAGQETT